MTLHESLETLGRVVRTAENRLDPQVVSSAESFLAGAAARRAEDMEVTVVAFAGMAIGNVLVPAYIKSHYPLRLAPLMSAYFLWLCG